VDYHAGLLRLLYAGQSDKREDEGSVLARIRDGEDERVEFKPFGRLESAKAEELVRTVIAFANKRGGTIYLGVNDHQEIEGVEKDLRESAPSEKRGSILECAAWYCAAIRKRIADRVSSAVVLECDSIRVCGKLLIHLTVLESKSKPCCDVSTKEIWTRRVANTVRPDPSGDELRQLIGGASQMMKIF
jgi:predicted HTH transcriptional regulator